MKALQLSNTYKEWGAFFIIAFLGFGTSFYWTKIALKELTILEVVTYRVTLSSICLWLIMPLFKAKVPTSLNLIWKMSFSGIIGNFIPFILTAWAMVHINSCIAGILNSLTPIFTIVLSFIFLRNKEINSRLLISVIVGFLGASLIFSDKLKIGNNIQEILPELAIILAAFCYAAQGVYIKYYFKNLNFVTLSVISSTASAILFWIILFVSQDIVNFPKQSTTIVAIAWMAIVASTIALTLLYYLLDRWPPTRVSFITYAVPIAAMFLGVVILGEQLKLNMIIGAGIIILSIILSNQKIRYKAK